MNIYIVTSGKGGTGKTLFAVALATYFLESNNLFAIDLNLTNPDFSKQLSRLKGVNQSEITLKVIRTVESPRSFLLTEISDDTKSEIIGYSVRSDPPYKLLDFGIISFYQYIDIILKSFYETYKVYPDNIVIDTNLSINNFVEVDRSSLIEINDMEFIKKYKIFFCHQWDSSYPFNKEKIKKIIQSKEKLFNIFNDFNDKNIIHCINPKVFITENEDAFFSNVRKIINNNNSCDMLTHEKLDYLIYILSQIKTLINEDDNEIFEMIVQSFMRISNTKFANLILISCIIKRLFKYIEHESNEITFYDFKQELEPLRNEIINQFLFFKTCN